jgi:hypothetical protein
MDYNTFKQALDAANHFIQETDGGDYASVDAILTMCYMDIRLQQVAMPAPVASQIATVALNNYNDTAPQWFADALVPMAGTRVTSGAVLKAAGRPFGMTELRQAGVWLRNLYGEPKRSNGQILFEIPGVKQASTKEEDPENPYHSSLPISTCALDFAALSDGEFTSKQIAISVGRQGTTAECHSIWEALTKNGHFPRGDIFQFGASKRR